MVVAEVVDADRRRRCEAGEDHDSEDTASVRKDIIETKKKKKKKVHHAMLVVTGMTD